MINYHDWNCRIYWKKRKMSVHASYYVFSAHNSFTKPLPAPPEPRYEIQLRVLTIEPNSHHSKQMQNIRFAKNKHWDEYARAMYVTSSALSAMPCSIRCPFQHSCTKWNTLWISGRYTPVSVARLIGRQEQADTRGQVTGRRRTSIAFSQIVILPLKKKKEGGGRGTIRSKLLPHEGGWESVVGIATPCGLDDPRIRTKAQPSSCTMDTWYFLEVWRPKGGADHPLASTAGLRMGWSYTSASSLCLHSQVMGRPFPLHTMVRGS